MTVHFVLWTPMDRSWGWQKGQQLTQANNLLSLCSITPPHLETQLTKHHIFTYIFYSDFLRAQKLLKPVSMSIKARADMMS